MGSLCWQILTKENHRIFREVLSWSVEKFPSGESKNDVKNRILSYLIQLNPKTLHVCVTHGVAISAVLSHIDPSLTLRPKNGSITPLLLENGKLSLSN
jgi:broad specificity phosphatase PhoE